MWALLVRSQMMEPTGSIAGGARKASQAAAISVGEVSLNQAGG